MLKTHTAESFYPKTLKTNEMKLFNNQTVIDYWLVVFVQFMSEKQDTNNNVSMK